MSIRLQLLVVALTTLVLPWAGWQYARELEAALRGSQEQSLLASAGTIGNALSAQPQRVFHEAGDRSFDARQGDLYVHPLTGQPLLDGYHDDWGTPFDATTLPTVTGYRARLQTGATERYLYFFLDVEDAHFDPEPNAPDLAHDRFDHVNLSLQTSDGANLEYFFATNAPGLIAAQQLARAEDPGAETAVRISSEPRIQAYWLQSARGYSLEGRIPLSLVKGRLWVQAIDGQGQASAGFPPAEHAEGGRLFFATGGLEELLATFIREGTRATVIDNNALKLGSAGSIATRLGGDGEEPWRSWYRRLMDARQGADVPREASDPNRLTGEAVQAALNGEPKGQWVQNAEGQPVLTAAAPIIVDGRTRGAVMLEQSADALLSLRDRALARLFNLTLLATAVAVAVMLGFASWIAFRIGRLRNAADAAVGNDGHLRLGMPGSGSTDEIGALARAFERLLGRLHEHTQYLRTLGGKLSHELRTPLTIVRSSLDNLESEGLKSEQLDYIRRAREGTLRLQYILTSLGAAARVEESIKQAERSQFDLRELLTAAVAGYRDGFPRSHIELDLPESACFLRGAPDLIAQMLDKLVENAVDFCPPAGTIRLGLRRDAGRYELSVGNDGPQIPAAVLEHLFESLYEQRQGHDDRPHFGLGLYIVRLIAEFHGGSAHAANREDGSGVIFTVSLPMI